MEKGKLTAKGHEGDGTVLCLNCDGGYVAIYICQKSSTYNILTEKIDDWGLVLLENSLFHENLKS